MLKIGLLMSGGLGFKVLKDLFKRTDVDFVCVFTDKKSLEIISFCNDYSIPLFVGNPRHGKGLQFVKRTGEIDMFFSINYLFIIEKDLINHVGLFALNIHGSLLPKYRGRTPHVWAVINGEKHTGVTIHKIVEEVDAGDVLMQKHINISEEDTGAMILDRFNDLYPIMINQAIDKVLIGNYEFKTQDNSKATYFGKRTPEDGRINWEWHKERIKDWVRAQARPYPGAFSYYENIKIIVNKVDYSDFGFYYDMINGLILSVDPLLVKTPNGVVEISDYEIDNENVVLKKGDILK